MATNKTIRGFHLSYEVVEQLKKLKEDKAVNLSKWVEKVIQREVKRELGEGNNGKIQ